MTRFYLLQGAAAVLVAAGAAQSQTTPSPPKPASSAAAQLPSIPVTAEVYDPNTYVATDTSVGTKTAAPIMETPLNVQVITQQVLQDQQAITLATALHNVSGVIVTDEAFAQTGGGSGGIILRGFVSQTYYRDGFRVDATGLGPDEISTRQLANIDSVEVMKGPGAILYGLVEPGGIINISTKQPQDTAHYAIEQQAGSLGDYRTTIDATGPLTRKGDLLYRVDLSYEYNAAPFGSKVDLVDSRNFFIAPVLKWNVSSSTWFKLDFEYDRNSSAYFTPTVGTYNNTFLTVPRHVNYGEPSPWTQQTIFVDLSGSHDLGGGWSIRGRLGFQNLTNFSNFTLTWGILDGPPVQLQNYSATINPDQNTYSGELDLTGRFVLLGMEHSVLLGGDVYRLDNHSHGDTYSMTVIDYYNPVYTGFPSPQSSCLFCGPFAWKNDQDTVGAYLQDQVKLPWNLHLMAGVRFQYIRQDSYQGLTSDTLIASGGTLYAHAYTPRVALLWRPRKWLSLYANYTEGFGANSGTIYPGTLAPPTSARSWEVGAKLEFFDGKLRISSDYFDLTKTNITAPDPDPLHDCGYGPGSCSILIGKVSSTGAELDIDGQILPGWSITANYSHNPVHATGTVTSADSTPYPAIGQQFPNQPYDIANVWSTYEFQAGRLKGLKFGGGIHYTSETPIWDDSNPVGTFAPLPAYATVDLMAAYRFQLWRKAATVQFNITNLFNRTYYVAASYDGAPLSQVVNQVQFGVRSYGAPFSAMGSIRVEF
jgi:iron complex outermembrane recepter protein